MTPVSVTPAGHGDMDSFVASVIGLFREDAGRHDPSMDVAWPVRDGMANYSGLLSEDSCLLAVGRDGDLIVGHLVGKLLEPDALRYSASPYSRACVSTRACEAAESAAC